VQDELKASDVNTAAQNVSAEEVSKESPAGQDPSAQDLPTQDVAQLHTELRAMHEELVALRKEVAEQARPVVSQPVTQTPLQRGNYYVGGTLSLSFRSRDDYETLLGTVDDGHRTTVKVEGLFGYLLSTNQLALGMSVTYRHSLNKGVLTDPATGDVNDANVVEYDLRVGPALRGFLPLDKNRQFFIYGQAAVLFGYGERVERAFTDTSSSVLSANGFSMGLAMQPGLMIAANEHFAFEVGINVLGIDYSNYKVTKDYTNMGQQKDVELSVDVNLLSLQFAFVGYF